MMTREEAIELKAAVGRLMYSDNKDIRDYNALIDFIESALRPVSREQVEKVKGEWIWDTNGLYPKPVCNKCGEEPYRRSNHTSDLPNYCPKCGCPMTDEAVEMVIERLEKARSVKE